MNEENPWSGKTKKAKNSNEENNQNNKPKDDKLNADVNESLWSKATKYAQNQIDRGAKEIEKLNDGMHKNMQEVKVNTKAYLEKRKIEQEKSRKEAEAVRLRNAQEAEKIRRKKEAERLLKAKEAEQEKLLKAKEAEQVRLRNIKEAEKLRKEKEVEKLIREKELEKEKLLKEKETEKLRNNKIQNKIKKEEEKEKIAVAKANAKYAMPKAKAETKVRVAEAKVAEAKAKTFIQAIEQKTLLTNFVVSFFANFIFVYTAIKLSFLDKSGIGGLDFEQYPALSILFLLSFIHIILRITIMIYGAFKKILYISLAIILAVILLENNDGITTEIIMIELDSVSQYFSQMIEEYLE